jgi:molybdate transport repressor ModE-like protein
MTIDPRRLLVLDAIASAGGITAASRVLHVSASAVSQHLTNLEREVGVALADRTVGGVRLTPAGRALARRATEVKDALLAAEDDLATVTGRSTGRVKVAAYATIASRIVAPALAQLAESHPGIDVAVHVESEEQMLLRQLTSGAADVAIVEELVSPQLDTQPHPVDEPATTAGWIATPICDDPYRIVIPAEWPAQEVASLITRPWVGGPPDSSVRVALARIGQAAGHEARVCHECCEFSSALDLVAAGMGAAIVPQLALARPPTGVTVTPLSEAGLRRLHAVRLGRPTRPRNAVLVFIDALRTTAQGT